MIALHCFFPDSAYLASEIVKYKSQKKRIDILVSMGYNIDKL